MHPFTDLCRGTGTQAHHVAQASAVATCSNRMKGRAIGAIALLPANFSPDEVRSSRTVAAAFPLKLSRGLLSKCCELAASITSRNKTWNVNKNLHTKHNMSSSDKRPEEQPCFACRVLVELRCGHVGSNLDLCHHTHTHLSRTKNRKQHCTLSLWPDFSMASIKTSSASTHAELQA